MPAQCTKPLHNTGAAQKQMVPCNRKRIPAIQNISKTSHQETSCIFSHSAEIKTPLSEIVHGKGLTAHQKVTWTEKAEKTFVDFKTALLSTPTLGLPDMTKPFTETADEKYSYMTDSVS